MRQGETFSVRLAVPGDLDAVDGLFRRSYPALLRADYPPSTMVTAIPLLARAQPRLLASGRYYVAERAPGTLIGAGGWSVAHPRSGVSAPGEASIRHLATDPACIRQGVASALMARIFDDARAAGITRFLCMSTRSGVPFYQSQGFCVVGPVDITLRPGIVFPAVEMTRA